MHWFCTLGSASVSKKEEGHPLQEPFRRFVVDFERAYESVQERAKRFAVFVENYNFIEAHNAKQDNTFTLGVNDFADLTLEEFKASHLGYVPPPKGTEGRVFGGAPAPKLGTFEATMHRSRSLY